MAKKTNKTKSKRRSTPKFKAKRSGSKPLMAKAATVRTAEPTSSMSRGSNRKRPTSPLNAALRKQAAVGGGGLGAYRKTQHEHEQSVKRETDDLAPQPSAQWKQAADGRGRLAYHQQHRQDFKREAADLASQPSADGDRNDGTRDGRLC